VSSILVGCKSDLRPNQGEDEEESDFGALKVVTRAQGKLMAWSLGSERYVECSSSTGKGVKDAREGIFDILLQRDPRARWRRAAKMVMLQRGSTQGY